MRALINSSISRTISSLIAVCILCIPAQAKYSGGSGTENDPYLISTPQHLSLISTSYEDWDKHFKLTADIEYTSIAFNFDIIGKYSMPFTGVFDGNGHKIVNFKIPRNDSPVGMFGYVNGSNAKIKNLELTNPIIEVEWCSNIGFIVGYLSAGTVSNCTVRDGKISVNGVAPSNIGGLVGENQGIVINCKSQVNIVTDGASVGGLVGTNEGHITKCSSDGEVTGSSYVGGITGRNLGTVVECFTTAEITGVNNGGLVGINRPEAMIKNCYSHGIVRGTNSSGGLVGKNLGNITNCYSIGRVFWVGGGLVGINDNGEIFSSYWDIETSGRTMSDGGIGKTTAEMKTASTYVDWGSEPIWTIDEGKDYPRLLWENRPGELIQLVKLSDLLQGTGTQNDPFLIYTAEELNKIGLFPSEWDKHFKLMEDLDLEGVTLNPIGYWEQGIDPELKPFTGVFDGNGKSIANFQWIYTRGSGSAGLFQYVYGNNAEIKDLTLINPTVDWFFAGSIVGVLEGSSVTGCTVMDGLVSGSNVGGLVGYAEYGVVKDCIIEGGNVIGGSYVGGLIGQIWDSVVENCHSSAEVVGNDHLGGLVGICHYNSLIKISGATGTVNGTEDKIGGLVGKCEYGSMIGGSFASGDVSGTNYIGGLVGVRGGSGIIYCYASGSVLGDDHIGGLIGGVSNQAGGWIADCYSNGRVDGMGEDVGGFSGDSTYNIDCFWDMETSGITDSRPFGRGLATAQMQNHNTFISAGWDFVGERENGPCDIWTMPDGGGYPILAWQASPLPPLPDFSGGIGEPNDPFIITTAEELNSIGHNPRLMASNFELDNDIDLGGIDFFFIGHEGFPFTGVFNGHGYTIRNFSHNVRREYMENIGLFSYVRGWNAEIKDLVIGDSRIVSEIPLTENINGTENVGLLVGQLYEGTVVNCHVESGEVLEGSWFEPIDQAGGLIGYNMYGTIKGCSSAVTIRGSYQIGGLLGTNRAGVVIDCHAFNAIINGFHNIGGLVGDNWAILGACSSSGTVSGSWVVGGLVGWNIYAVLESCSYSDVIGGDSVGGLVGENIGYILNTYARGSVSGNKNVGGLVGDNTYRPRVSGDIETSYSTGLVSGNENIGGLAYKGDNAATTSNDCFWDIETSGQTMSDGGIGKTTSQMQTASTFLDAGWDFVGETENGMDDFWWIDEGIDYPRLWWELLE